MADEYTPTLFSGRMKSGPKPDVGSIRRGLTLNRVRVDWRAAMQSTEPAGTENAPKKPPSGYKWMKPGERYGQVVTIERVNKRAWRCVCDCGREFVTYGTHLRSGVTTSCGHWRAERDPDSYNAVHLRVNRERGPASGYTCVDCERPAVDWSYNRSGVRELRGVRDGYELIYSTDIEQYEPRCKRCHNRLDHSFRGARSA